MCPVKLNSPLSPPPPHTHRGAVLSVAFGLGGEVCYSGSSDSTIRVWRVPEESEDDPFSVYGEDGGHLLESFVLWYLLQISI